MKLPFEVWEVIISTGQTKKHSAFEKLSDATKMKRALEARPAGKLYVIHTVYNNN